LPKWSDERTSIDVSSIEASKVVGVQPTNPHNQVFVDLYLASGQTLQITLSFTEHQVAEINALGPCPKTSAETRAAREKIPSWPGHLGDSIHLSRRAKENHLLRLSEYEAKDNIYRALAEKDWQREQDWWVKLEELGAKFGAELYQEFLKEIGWSE